MSSSSLESFPSTESSKPKRRRTKTKSLNFDLVDNILHMEEQERREPRQVKNRKLYKWVLTLLIGLATGIVAVLVQRVVQEIEDWRHDLSIDLVYEEKHWRAGLVYVVFNMLLVILASSATSIFAPWLTGSGVEDVKAYINGVRLPHVISFKTFIVKLFALIMGVSGSLTLGKEGPLTHIGAVLGAGLSQGSRFLAIDFKWAKMSLGFKNEVDLRHFVTCGAAAGVTAAFGAPIAGLMFAIESSMGFWDSELTWRTFLACLVCSFTYGVLRNDPTEPLETEGMISAYDSADERSFYGAEMALFFVMGIFGGAAGVFFNTCNKKLARWRLRAVQTPPARIFEATLVGVITSLCFFTLPYLASCHKNVEGMEEYEERFNCKEGEYNDLATLLVRPKNDAIRHLLTQGTVGEFELGSLATCCFLFFILSFITYGISVPGGLFNPLMIVGCSYGRFVGHLLDDSFDGHDFDPGVYALVGGAALVGGTMRRSVSLVISLMEITGEIRFLLPIMAAIFGAKVVGDWWGSGLYNALLQIRGIPVLPEKLPRKIRYVAVEEIMAPDPITLNVFETAGDVLQILRQTSHNGFPVVAGEVPRTMLDSSTALHYVETRKGTLVGFIERRHLLAILLFLEENGPGSLSKLRYRDLWTRYNKAKSREFVDAEEFELSEQNHNELLDLHRVMNQHPYTAHSGWYTHRAYSLFCGMGLSHLCVVNYANEVVGIVTRHDFLAAIRRCSAEAKEATHQRPDYRLPVHERNLSTVHSVEDLDAHHRGGRFRQWLRDLFHSDAPEEQRSSLLSPVECSSSD
eukprot:Rmarinus@m.25235